MFKTYCEIDLDLISKELENNKALITNTDTIIGIMSLNEQLIFDIKERSLDKKVVRFIKSIEQVPNLNEQQKDFLNKFWPGQITIIKDCISYRIPDNKFILKLLAIHNVLYCSSANISNKPVVKTIYESSIMFNKKWEHHLFLVCQKNFITTEYQSTIIDIDSWTIIREGSNKKEVIEYIKHIKKN